MAIKTLRNSGDRKAVIVTGCSSGIGRQVAVTLAENGFLVFATVRKEKDRETLNGLGLPGLLPVYPLDLTSLEHISNARNLISAELKNRQKKGLDGLINSAGGGVPAPVELLDLQDFHRELKARILGSTAMAQAFLPLLREARGRILWIMTPALVPTPYVSMIHACDFAVNCIARTLDIELKRSHVSNIMIRCGGIRTPAGLRTARDVEALLQEIQPERAVLYEKPLREWALEMEKFDGKRTAPHEVAAVVLKALLAGKPRRRYSVGYMSRAAAWLEMFPQPVTDWILKKRF
ncbi:MAG: SDR family NAD(P)-dependent oxidoreductase [Acidobacteriota bacterium]|nr:SDR family NAD(P)-dependent oxidoreductase [Acidobacteriota bacterium]